MSRPAPYVPGDQEHPEWWTSTDDEILAGELAKLDGLPRPAALPQRLVPGAPAATPAAPPRWRVLATLAVVLLTVALVALVAAAPGRPAPAIAPTTYGPPGPRGGFTSMPAR